MITELALFFKEMLRDVRGWHTWLAFFCCHGDRYCFVEKGIELQAEMSVAQFFL